jgi:hypothetical protein
MKKINLKDIRLTICNSDNLEKTRPELLLEIEAILLNLPLTEETRKVLSFPVPYRIDCGTYQIDRDSQVTTKLIFLILDKGIIFKEDGCGHYEVRAWTNGYGVWRVAFADQKYYPDPETNIFTDAGIDGLSITNAFQELNGFCDGFSFEFAGLLHQWILSFSDHTWNKTMRKQVEHRLQESDSKGKIISNIVEALRTSKSALP